MGAVHGIAPVVTDKRRVGNLARPIVSMSTDDPRNPLPENAFVGSVDATQGYSGSMGQEKWESEGIVRSQYLACRKPPSSNGPVCRFLVFQRRRAYRDHIAPDLSIPFGKGKLSAEERFALGNLVSGDRDRALKGFRPGATYVRGLQLSRLLEVIIDDFKLEGGHDSDLVECRLGSLQHLLGRFVEMLTTQSRVFKHRGILAAAK